MSPAALFKRALAEKLAFTPMGPQGPQAAGPGGAPMDPGAGAPPPSGDPSGAAGAPPAGPPPGGDPAGAGAPPPGGDPSGGAAPMDPSAGGAPPAGDPSASDPSAEMPPMPETPPEPPPKDPVDEQSKARQQLGTDDAMVPLSQLKEFTVGVIEATKGKKTQEAAIQEAKEDSAPPAQAPGPVTGMPGFDPSALGGPLKTAAILKFLLKR